MRVCLLLVAATVAAVAVRAVHPVGGEVFVSDVAGHRMSLVGNLSWVDAGPAFAGCSSATRATICIDPTSKSARRQKIDGVGGSFLRSGAIVLNLMSPPQQEKILEALFHPEKGAGFRLGKVPMTATDFMPKSYESADHFYTYEDERGAFSVRAELAVNGTIDYIRRAQAAAGRRILLEAPMDYVPAWMLNATEVDPASPFVYASVNRTLFPRLASYFLDFAMQFKAHGAELEYLCAWNEPSYFFPPNAPRTADNNHGSYQVIDVEDIFALHAQHVGPLFRRTAGAPKITWGAQYGRRGTWGRVFVGANNTPASSNNNYTAMMLRPEMLPYIDMIAAHGYDCADLTPGFLCQGNTSDAPREQRRNASCQFLSGAVADLKKVYDALPASVSHRWITENCYAVEFGDWPRDNCPTLPLTYFEDAMNWGRFHFGDFNAGATGTIYWNMILDRHGGPWNTAPRHNDPPGNYQHPLVIADWASDNFTLTGAYYAYAHFGRWATGKSRLWHERSPQLVPNADDLVSYGSNVYQMAFLSDDAGELVVVLMNDQWAPAELDVVVAGGGAARTARVTLPPVSLVTLRVPLAQQP